ncbi:MAG: hypothetical protein KGV59_01310 [Tenacibaculum sp.]|nr:hypothetical protein [Tenacibaculum sp.]
MEILIGIVVVIGIVIFISRNSKSNTQKETQKTEPDIDIKKLVREMFQQVFPNGQKDIQEGTNALLNILNHSVDRKTAEDIFVKSSVICHGASIKQEFNKERLKTHLAPYALHYFNNVSFNEFYNYLISRNSKALLLNEFFNRFNEEQSRSGTDQDEMPQGYGEFGLDITNPIPVRSVPDSYNYLKRLRTAFDDKLTYDRIGSMNAPNIEQIIDAYNLYLDNKKIATIYICPYNKKTSSKAPKGLKLVS